MYGMVTGERQGRPDGGSATRAVSRALSLLEIVGLGQGVSLAEAARAVDLSTSTALRLLRTLEGSGFVQRVSDGTFLPGPRVLAIGGAAVSGLPLPRLAEPHLVRLCEQTGESCYLAVEGPQQTALYVRQQASPHAVRHASWVGRTVPLDGTAVGAVLRGQTDADGCVATRATLEPGVTAVSGMLRGPGGTVLGAMSVVAPTFRVSDVDLERIRRDLAGHAEELSTQLGWPGEQ